MLAKFLSDEYNYNKQVNKQVLLPTSVLTLIRPSSVNVLISITGMPSSSKLLKISC
jgi:hypothetical protein